VLYADAPVSLPQALAEGDLCVCHAGEATLAQSLLAGVPLLMLPSHTEQFLNARRVAMSGAGYNAALADASFGLARHSPGRAQ
jgi:UDP:flavonoid glycosyltransferase YjiC (YdhE family)